MQQAALYDIPNAKKRLARLQTAVPELSKKAKECREMSKQYKAGFKKTCEDLGIEGVSIEAELRLLANNLPAIYTEVGAVRLLTPGPGASTARRPQLTKRSRGATCRPSRMMTSCWLSSMQTCRRRRRRCCCFVLLLPA